MKKRERKIPVVSKHHHKLDRMEYYRGTTEIGSAMRALRTTNQVRLREVAKFMGFTLSYVAQLEQGRSSWTPDHAAKFTAAVRAYARKS